MFKKIITLSFKEIKINYFKKCDRHHETQGNYLNKITYFGGEAKERKKHYCTTQHQLQLNISKMEFSIFNKKLKIEVFPIFNKIGFSIKNFNYVHFPKITLD